jgi:dolichyl-phosphate beta-glucosyltransferase
MQKKLKQFFWYCVVGGIGTGVDIGVLFLMHGILLVPLLPATAIAFFVAVVSNFLGNKFFTFRDTSKRYSEQFIKFLSVSIVGLILTLFLMQLFTVWIGIFYIFSKLLTSGIVLVWNFFANAFWTFREETNRFSWDHKYFLDLSIIVPSYNEEKRLGNTLEKIFSYFEKQKYEFEVIVVDDGSIDNTKDIAQKIFQKYKNGQVLSFQKNRGKGHAVRSGVEIAKGKYILFTDADGSTPIEEFETLFSYILEYNIAIGSRYLQKEKIKISQPKYRVFLGRFANQIIQKLFFSGIQDTQCGFKLFRNVAAKDIFSRQRIDRFGFDIEILSIAKIRGYSVIEVPVAWYNAEGSRFRPIRDVLITLRDVLRIKWNLLWGKYS